MLSTVHKRILLIIVSGAMTSACNGALTLDPKKVNSVCANGVCIEGSSACVGDNCPDGSGGGGDGSNGGNTRALCGPLAPDTGACDNDQICINGICRDPATVGANDYCNVATQLRCSSNETCAAGACQAIDASLACSAQKPNGTCPAGQQCIYGECFTNDDVACSDGNTNGYCPSGQICLAQGCVTSPVTCSANLPHGTCSAWQSCVSNSCIGPLPPDGCSPELPHGRCAAGAVCAGGECLVLDADNACSANNVHGLCPPDSACVAGQCHAIAASNACAHNQPHGLCANGETCQQGVCVEQLCGAGGYGCDSGHYCDHGVCAPWLCSPQHPTGTCDEGLACYQGTCISDACGGTPVNSCGGCATLAATRDTPCGECNDGIWTCDGTDAITCNDATRIQGWYPDNDGDGFGNTNATPIASCRVPTGLYVTYVNNALDCDDHNRLAYGGAQETCNNVDDDCDGVIDNAPHDMSCTGSDACCEDSKVCTDGLCRNTCDNTDLGQNGVRCGQIGSETCCTGSDICYGDRCLAPTPNVHCCQQSDVNCNPLAVNNQCPSNTTCDGESGHCFPVQNVPACTLQPAACHPGHYGDCPLAATVACRFHPSTATQAGVSCTPSATTPCVPNPHHEDVVATPVVLDLTGDDVPEIAFLTYNLQTSAYNFNTPAYAASNSTFALYSYGATIPSKDRGCCNTMATLRIVSGVCNDDTDNNSATPAAMHTLASISGIIGPDQALGLPSNYYKKAFNLDTAYHTDRINNDTAIASADLNQDGTPEIIVLGRAPSTSSPRGIIVYTRGIVHWPMEETSQGPAWTGATPTITDVNNGTVWSTLWHQPFYPTSNHTIGGAAISVADLDQDGTPEVIVGNVVLNGRNGALKWDGRVTSGGTGGIGTNAFLGPSSTVANIDLDGTRGQDNVFHNSTLEVVAGNSVYNHDGTVRWTYPFSASDSNSLCDNRGGPLCDGFNGVANFDSDEQAEIVIVRQGVTLVLNHTGSLYWRMRMPVLDSTLITALNLKVTENSPNLQPCSKNEGGPPNIADFDGDGRPEIGVAAADFYMVLDKDCDPMPTYTTGQTRVCGRVHSYSGGQHVETTTTTPGIRWMVRNQDCSSRVTGSSVFDFEGDGVAEVLYADEVSFRVFDGATGLMRYNDTTHRSHTRLETPIVVDVDYDNNADFVIAENRNGGGTTPGLAVWRDPLDRWVRTRRIWNQHAYYVTNIQENGSLYADGTPSDAPNWLNPHLNNFRQNVQLEGQFDAPDLTVTALSASRVRATCPVSQITLTMTVSNAGAISVKPGASVQITASSGSTNRVMGTYKTQTRLYPGSTETMIINLDGRVSDLPSPITFTAVIDPDHGESECHEDNNVRTVPVTCQTE